MPVPNTMADLFQAAASNSPAGSEAIGNSLDNYLRAQAAILRQTYALASSSIASASTINVSASDGENVQITGTATINSLGTGFNGCRRELRFAGACTLTHSTSLQLPGATNITTAAGLVYSFRCIGSNTWIYTGGNTLPLGVTINTAQTITGAKTFTGVTEISGQSLFEVQGGATDARITLQDSAGVRRGLIYDDYTALNLVHYNAIGGVVGQLTMADDGTLKYLGSTIWHAGNFTPTSVPSQNTDFTVHKTTPSFLGVQSGLEVGRLRFLVGAENAALLSANVGTVYLRPNGDGSSTGEFRVTSAGSAIASGSIFSSGIVSDAAGDVRRLGGRVMAANSSVAAADMNTVIEKNATGAMTLTLGSGLGQVRDAVSVVNSSTSGNLTIARSGTVLYQNGVDANIAVAPGSSVTIIRSNTANRWIA